MSDEKITHEIETKEEHKCFCQSKSFRNFLVIALGTFVGVYAALSLFTALHRPPVFHGAGFGAYPAPFAAPCPCKAMMIQHHLKKHDEHFGKKAPKDLGRKAPFEAQHSEEIDD